MKAISKHFTLIAVFFLTSCANKVDAPETMAVTGKKYATAEDAVTALVQAAKDRSTEAVKAVLGPQSADIVSSGDDVQDYAELRNFERLYAAKHYLEGDAERTVLFIGENEFPFPIPLVQRNGSWSFDSAQGREELINRRIGKNELAAISNLQEFVAAENDYFQRDPDGDGVHEYTRKFFSSPGKKDGLFWRREAKEEPSPLGPLAIQAAAEGYQDPGAGKRKGAAYHGYRYRLLSAQAPDKSCASGACQSISYLDKSGRMTQGFAFTATPKEWGVSGVMSFVVNKDGVVYEKNLGEDSDKIFSAMSEYSIDDTWARVEE